MNQYGCFDRPPIVTFGATSCQYTKTPLGQADKKCEGCSEYGSRPATQEQWEAFGKQCMENANAIGDAIARHFDSNKRSDCA